jgi:two-component system, OmpR family, KDP operon response regulator KdpE
MSAKVQGLVVDDERTMRRFLATALESHGFGVIEASSCREALAQFTSHRPDFVILDLGLPDGDGLDVTRQLRAFSRVPIVVLSARGREQDKVKVLDAGADDYVTKPFGTDELLARIRVALRHAAGRTEVNPRIELGELCVDLERRVVSLGGAEVHLTPIEYKILALLAQHVDKVVTHTQLLSEIWGPKATEQTHYLRVHMAQLRRKIEPTPARPRYLLTEPGVGYRLREQPGG